MTNYIAFDIEISRTIPDGVDDWSTLHPLGITCAATWKSDENKPMVWCGHDAYGAIAAQMTPVELQRMIAYMQAATYQGYQIITFAGAGFDFLELAAASGEWEICRQLALGHVDMFFGVFALLGYGPGLNRVAKGMGLAGKTEGMDGAKAPELWQRGEYGKVLQYVAQDVRTTLDVAQAVEREKWLRWTSKSNASVTVRIERWFPVIEAMNLPLPDVSWMAGKEWKREKFVGWLL